MQTSTSVDAALPPKRFFCLPRLRCLGLFALFFGIVIGLQYLGGAYRAEFGSEPDEAGHYVTGLFVRDYIAAGFPFPPRRFAEDYYNHYPKVALGHWPPMFYLAQSVWTLPLSPNRTSILLFMAALAATIGMLIFKIFEEEFGTWRALAGALIFLAIPLVQQYFSAVMTEIPMTLLFLLATFYFIRYLETERRAYAIAFGLTAAIAILTKFNGYALALVPPLAVVFSRRIYLVKRFSFWIPAIIVAVLALPWTVATLKIASDGLVEEKWGWSFSHKAVPYYFQALLTTGGIALLFLAAFGFIIKVFVRRKTKPAHATFAALLVAILFLHMSVPAGFEARHMVPAMAVVVFFAWAGTDWIAGWLADRGLKLSLAMMFTFGLAILLFAVEVFRIPHKGYTGFGPVAVSLLQNPQAQKTSFLVSSDARGEGMFISEVARHEKRPGHIVQRASKKLSAADWNGGGYRLVYTAKPGDKHGQDYKTEDDLLALLRKDSIDYFVLDDSVAEKAQRMHHKTLHTTFDKYPDIFKLEGTFPMERAGIIYPNGIKLYHLNRGS